MMENLTFKIKSDCVTFKDVGDQIHIEQNIERDENPFICIGKKQIYSLIEWLNERKNRKTEIMWIDTNDWE